MANEGIRMRTKGVRLTKAHHAGLNVLACVQDTSIQALADQALQEFIERQSAVNPSVAAAVESLEKAVT